MTEQAAPMHPSPPTQTDINMIKIPLLVSGILNAIAAVTYLIAGLFTIVFIVGCFILPIGALFGVLAYFEIRAFMRLGDPNYPNPELKPHVKMLSILEICAIIFGSISSLICGIIIITNIDKIKDA